MESPELDPISPDEPEEFVVTKKMKMTGNYTIIIEPSSEVTEEMTEETGETGEVGTTEPIDEFGMTGDSRGFFSDSATVTLDASTFEDTPEGYLKLSNITIAKVMVQKYQDSRGKDLRVLKAVDALKGMIEFGSGRPVTDEHPDGGVVMSRKDTRGFIDNLYFTDTNEAKADVYITCPRLKKTVKNGDKSEVSIGFYSNIDNTPGIYNDQEYDQVQTDIWLDHLAIVKNGRCSRKDGCGITDSVKRAVKVVKVVNKITPAPAKIMDSASVVAEKTKIINEIHLLADSDINKSELMGMSVKQINYVKDLVQVSKGPAFNMDGSKRESIDDVIARLQSKE